jgi:hypothetical protein
MVQAWIVEGLIILFIGAFVVAAVIKLVKAIRGLLKKEPQ